MPCNLMTSIFIQVKIHSPAPLTEFHHQKRLPFKIFLTGCWVSPFLCLLFKGGLGKHRALNEFIAIKFGWEILNWHSIHKTKNNSKLIPFLTIGYFWAWISWGFNLSQKNATIKLNHLPTNKHKHILKFHHLDTFKCVCPLFSVDENNWSTGLIQESLDETLTQTKQHRKTTSCYFDPPKM